MDRRRFHLADRLVRGLDAGEEERAAVVVAAPPLFVFLFLFMFMLVVVGYWVEREE